MKRFGRFGSKFDRYDGPRKGKEYSKDCNKIIRRSQLEHIKEELASEKVCRGQYE